MTFELSSTISKSGGYEISHSLLIYGTCPHSLRIGYQNLNLPSLDVDSSDGRAVCSTISQLKCSSLFLAWKFFNSVSLHNCISYSFPCNWSLKHRSHCFLPQPSLLSIRSSVVVYSGLAFITLKALGLLNLSLKYTLRA